MLQYFRKYLSEPDKDGLVVAFARTPPAPPTTATATATSASAASLGSSDNATATEAEAVPRGARRERDDGALVKLWLAPPGDSPKWVFLQCDRVVEARKVGAYP